MEQEVEQLGKVVNMGLPAVTELSIKGEMQLEMLKKGYQELTDKINSLEYNEDNLVEISEAITKLKGIKKVIDEKHATGKARYWEVCKAYDAAKNSQVKLVDDLLATPVKKYNELCRQIDERKRLQEEKIRKDKELRAGIEKNLSFFSAQVGAAKTTKDLVAIEKAIGTEKSRKDKYGEFWDEAQTRYNTLADLIKGQKKKIEESDKLKKQIEEQSKQEEVDLDAIEANRERLAEVEENITEGAIKAQEGAIDYATGVDTSLVHAEEILPTVKPKRSIWKWEVKDIALTAKKMPSFVTLEPNKDAIDLYLKMKKEEGIEGEEFTVSGIRFFLEKTY